MLSPVATLLVLLLPLSSSSTVGGTGECTPSALCKRRISSVEVRDRRKVLFSFEDTGPSIAFGLAPDEEGDSTTFALASSGDEHLDDPQALVEAGIKQGFRRVAGAEYQPERRALCVDLQNPAGAIRRFLFFCAETDGASVTHFDRVAVTEEY